MGHAPVIMGIHTCLRERALFSHLCSHACNAYPTPLTTTLRIVHIVHYYRYHCFSNSTLRMYDMQGESSPQGIKKNIVLSSLGQAPHQTWSIFTQCCCVRGFVTCISEPTLCMVRLLYMAASILRFSRVCTNLVSVCVQPKSFTLLVKTFL